jgi:hypothetical protein
MALTYRGQLDRPLTTEEIDANFAYFTGSHGITGSLGISGSIIPAVGVGEITSSFDLGSPTAAWKDIYVSEGSIKFVKSGSDAVVLSAKDGGIQVNGGPTISADGINGQFFTSKSLDTNITVKDYNNSLLMGPIDIENGKEIIVEEDSDLTIFGDIEIQNVATADTALFASSASFSDTSSYAVTASYTDTSSYASSASFSNTSSYAVTASYALNSSCSCIPFPYSGSAVITGSLIVNNGTNNVINTSNYQLIDSNNEQTINWNTKILKSGNKTTIDWSNKLLQDGSESSSVDWESRLLTDASTSSSVDWESRRLYNSDGGTAIDYSDSASLSLIAGNSTLNVSKHSTFIADNAGSLTFISPSTKISGSIWLDATTGIYGFTSASSTITGSTPGGGQNTSVAFAQSGANFFIYVYIGGQWRSASLS